MVLAQIGDSIKLLDLAVAGNNFLVMLLSL
jgi:hypothetical protein